jgi:hypothetical protein
VARDTPAAVATVSKVARRAFVTVAFLRSSCGWHDVAAKT